MWPEDGDKVDTLIIGNEAFKNTSQMLTYFSDLFREYPYEKYGHAAAFPYGFGGMEHNTMTTVHRNWLRGYSEIGIAHEVVHHWIGDMITCATWNDLWINEGGASWGEALWQGQLGGENAYINHMFNHYYTYNRSVERNDEYSLKPMYGVPENELFGKGAVLNYPKAAWIYHMLYEWSGREPFIEALKRLFEEYNFEAVESADFERIMKEELTDFPVPIENFFDDFVYNGGMPFFSLHGNYYETQEQFIVEVDIDQIQEGEEVPEVFDSYMQIVFFYENESGEQETIYTDPFVCDKRSMSKTFELDVEPDSMTVSRRRLLCLPVESNLVKFVSVNERTEEELKIYPTPVIAGEMLKIEYTTNNSVQSNFIITDAIGNVLHNTIKNTIHPGKHIIEIPTNDLSSGVYYGKMIIGKEIKNFSIPVIK
jgi:aminopeptidase N